MSCKKAYFYWIELLDNQNNKKDISELKPIFQNIFKENSSNKCLKLDDKIDNKVKMDILRDDNYLFCKLSKEKDNALIQIRDSETNKANLVINPRDIDKKAIEIYTYFLLDYQQGIVSIIHGRSAPSEKILINILDRYNTNYKLQINNVFSIDSYKKLYKKGSKLAKICVEFSKPNDEIVASLLGRSPRGKILNNLTENKKKLILEISASSKKKYISDNEEETPEYMQPIIDNLNMKADVIFKGAEEGKRSNIYSVGKKQLSCDAVINTFTVENKQRIYYNQEEINQEYQLALLEAYRINKNDILSLIDR